MRAYWIKETELTFGVIFLSRVSYMSKRYKKTWRNSKLHDDVCSIYGFAFYAWSKNSRFLLYCL